ncbi:MAG: hypothetical protein J5379_09675 [Clostridiales bacterium]|nr:hypothetical protein [Clostridiales bacterium]
MKKFEITAVLEEACRQTLLCRMFLKADPNCYSCFPIKAGEDLFLYMDEQDFRLDGYVVRRLKDIVEINSKQDLTSEILESEGVTASVEKIDIDISSWEKALSYLSKHRLNAIFESEDRNSGNIDYVIGRVEKIDDRYLYVRAFDYDGKWEEKPTRIAFSELVSISFGTRYVEIFTKYLPPCPVERDISLLPKSPNE